MTVFELIGHTAVIDWGDRSESVCIALFSTYEKAEARVAEIKSKANWHMDWGKFSINEVVVH